MSIFPLPVLYDKGRSFNRAKRATEEDSCVCALYIDGFFQRRTEQRSDPHVYKVTTVHTSYSTMCTIRELFEGFENRGLYDALNMNTVRCDTFVSTFEFKTVSDLGRLRG